MKAIPNAPLCDDLYERARKIEMQRIRDRVNKHNRNALIVFTGGPGTGKSYSSIEFALEIDYSFVVEEQLTSGRYGVGDFIRLLNSGTLRKGNAVIMDEAGVMVPRREWYTELNKAVDMVFQTFRSDNLCVILNTPSLDYIDKHTQLLFNYYYETLEINEKKGYVKVKPFTLKYNPLTGKQLHPYPICFIDELGYSIRADRYKFQRPPQDVLDRYEKMKKKSNIDTKALAEIDIQREIEKEGGKHIVAGNIADEIIKKGELIKYSLAGKPKLSRYDIVRVYHCGFTFAELVRSNVFSKLYRKPIKAVEQSVGMIKEEPMSSVPEKPAIQGEGNVNDDYV
jgi:hypothetical protein